MSLINMKCSFWLWYLTRCLNTKRLLDYYANVKKPTIKIGCYWCKYFFLRSGYFHARHETIFSKFYVISYVLYFANSNNVQTFLLHNIGHSRWRNHPIYVLIILCLHICTCSDINRDSIMRDHTSSSIWICYGTKDILVINEHHILKWRLKDLQN